LRHNSAQPDFAAEPTMIPLASRCCGCLKLQCEILSEYKTTQKNPFLCDEKDEEILK